MCCCDTAPAAVAKLMPSTCFVPSTKSGPPLLPGEMGDVCWYT